MNPQEELLEAKNADALPSQGKLPGSLSGEKIRKMFLFWPWLPPLIWMAVIFYFSSLPSLHASEVYWQDFLIKKTAHFIEYFILAFLFQRSLRKTTRLSPAAACLLAFIMSVLYAVSDEYHQSFVPGREPRFRDVGIDSLGASIASLMAFLSSKTKAELNLH